MALLLVLFLVVGLTAGLVLGLIDNRSSSELFEAGEEAFRQAEYEKAIELYEKGLEKKPDYSAGYNLLGMAYRFTFNKTGSAAARQKEIMAFRKAIELDPDNFVAYVNLGTTLFYHGSAKEGAVYLKKALELYPGHPDRAAIEEMIRQAEPGP